MVAGACPDHDDAMQAVGSEALDAGPCCAMPVSSTPVSYVPLQGPHQHHGRKTIAELKEKLESLKRRRLEEGDLDGLLDLITEPNDDVDFDVPPDVPPVVGVARLPQSDLGRSGLVEVFSGVAGLTAAVRRQGGDANIIQDEFTTVFDITINDHFQNLKKMTRGKKVRWLHGAPPCRTFSRARKRDK